MAARRRGSLARRFASHFEQAAVPSARLITTTLVQPAVTVQTSLRTGVTSRLRRSVRIQFLRNFAYPNSDSGWASKSMMRAAWFGLLGFVGDRADAGELIESAVVA